MFVAFEGPIAVGKTTLAGLYGTYRLSTVLYEEFAINDFLADFYADKTRWSLPMQLSFLLARHKQLASTPPPLEKLLVADYAFIKNEIFAELLLDDRELRLFTGISRTLGTTLDRPDVIVHLDATNDVLLKRIAGRGRPYETHIDGSYLDNLRAAYNLRLGTQGGSALVKFNTSSLDLHSSDQLNEIFHKIDSAVQG